MRTLRVRLLLGACLIALWPAASAAASVVPGEGIAGVRLRMTESQVRARLGPPVRVTTTKGALGFVVTRLHYRSLDVDLQRLDRRPVVIRVLTTRRRERTPSGLGVGSTLAAVLRLPGVRCSTQPPLRYCGVGRLNAPLGRFTLFWIGARGRVTTVSVALTVDS